MSRTGFEPVTPSLSVPGRPGSPGCKPAIGGSRNTPGRSHGWGVAVTSAVTLSGHGLAPRRSSDVRSVDQCHVSGQCRRTRSRKSGFPDVQIAPLRTATDGSKDGRPQVQYLLFFPLVAIRFLLATDVEERLQKWIVCPCDLAEQVEAFLVIGHQRRAVDRGGRPAELCESRGVELLPRRHLPGPREGAVGSAATAPSHHLACGRW
jgi:hypothetical protein